MLHKRHNENVLFGSIIQLHHPLALYLHPAAHIRYANVTAFSPHRYALQGLFLACATRGLRGCETIRRFTVILSKYEEKMTDKIWLTDREVGTRFGSTRQWVWTQARNNPQFPRPVKITPRWSRWCLQEIEAFEQEALAARG